RHKRDAPRFKHPDGHRDEYSLSLKDSLCAPVFRSHPCPLSTGVNAHHLVRKVNTKVIRLALCKMLGELLKTVRKDHLIAGHPVVVETVRIEVLPPGTILLFTPVLMEFAHAFLPLLVPRLCVERGAHRIGV